MEKQTLKKLLIFALLLAIFTSLVSSQRVYAGVWGDAWNYIKEKFNNTHTELNSEALGEKTNTPVSPYKPALEYEAAVVSAVDSASPSVVSVSASKNVPLIEECPYDPFSDMSPEFRDFFGQQNFQFSRPCESKQTERKEVGGGSGFVVSEDGLILTNKHVIADAKADYTVFTNDGKKYPAKILAKDPVNDIAILKVDAKLKPAKLGNSDEVKLAQTAIAIGNALGEYRNTVSVGVISGLARTVTAQGAGVGAETIKGVLQTDAAINPGNSGGPLLNLRGEVIGINTAMASGAQNIGFAIPINDAIRAINSVKATGSIKVPYLGVRFIMLNEEIAKKQKLSISVGALVRGGEDGPAVMKKSPADKAGIQAEDIILSVNNEKLSEEKPLSQVIQKYSIGDTITLEVQRGSEKKSFSVTLEERPTDSN